MFLNVLKIFNIKLLKLRPFFKHAHSITFHANPTLVQWVPGTFWLALCKLGVRILVGGIVELQHSHQEKCANNEKKLVHIFLDFMDAFLLQLHDSFLTLYE